MSPPRHALITGGSRGIGLAIANLFANSGYRITLLARNESALRTAVSNLPSSHLPSDSQHNYIITRSISDAGFWTISGDSNCFGNQYEGSGDKNNIDVLVNCAGISQNRAFVRMAPEEVRDIVDTNLTGTMMATRFLLSKRYIRSAGLRKAEDGGEGFSPAIINVSSLLGVRGGMGAVAYAASKAGIIGFTRALAAEVGRSGIRVNAIVPGYVSTDMTTDLEKSQDLRNSIPAGRFGKPEEIADAALFLARNQYANNCVLNLDGGLSAV